MCEILRAVGATVTEDYEKHTITVDGSTVDKSVVPFDLVKKERASFFIMGPLLARMGKVNIALPGGCAIGERPVDLHTKGIKMLGARVVTEDGEVNANADRLKGSLVYLDFPSVGATENIMMAATLAEGETIIENAAEEPEIVDLANFLNSMGAQIKGAGTDTIRVNGVDKLHGTRYAVIPDRIETATFMIAAATTRGNVLIKNCIPDHVRPIMAKLIECGVDISDELEGLRVRGDVNPMKATDIKTLPYPGFPTDMNPQTAVLLCCINGISRINETIFNDRFRYINELRRMGAIIDIDNGIATIKGGIPLKAASVRAVDLRAGAAMVLAGLVAEGNTSIDDIFYIERGYDSIVEKLASLKAIIKRVKIQDIT
jgi:UDP-N-acetylglucosamine 1-carboxyvinyltransferase